MKWLLEMLGDIVSGCCGTLVLLIVLAAVVSDVHEKLWLRRFRKAHAGETFLVATRRNRWFDFIINNVVPVLPPGTTVIWLSRDRDADDPLRRALRAAKHPDVPRPLLVYVTPFEITSVPLHASLWPLKNRAPQRDTSVQEQVALIIESAMHHLSTYEE
jgi:hypothetical protein